MMTTGLFWDVDANDVEPQVVEVSQQQRTLHVCPMEAKYGLLRSLGEMMLEKEKAKYQRSTTATGYVNAAWLPLFSIGDDKHIG
jgi:hypothetical protein